MNKNIESLKIKCINDNIPIARDLTIKFMLEQIKKNNYKTLLEIGTAYGYSTQCFAKLEQVKEITTIERDIKKIEIASRYNQYNKISFLNMNCFDFKPTKKYDFIFIDGPKSKQKDLILLYLNYLNDNGMIIIDNLILSSVRNKKNKSKANISILKKIDDLNEFLRSQKLFHFEFINIDDGIGVITKYGITKR